MRRSIIYYTGCGICRSLYFLRKRGIFLWLIIGLAFLGGLVGFFLFSKLSDEKPLRIVGKTQQAATIALLFLLGVWLGGNDEFWTSIRTTGLHGILFALCTIAGSAAAIFFLARLAKLGVKK